MGLHKKTIRCTDCKGGVPHGWGAYCKCCTWTSLTHRVVASAAHMCMLTSSYWLHTSESVLHYWQ